MEKESLKLTYKRKSTILFIEYFVFSLFFQIIYELLGLVNELEYSNNFFIVFFFSTSTEFIFKKTLLMHFYKVELDIEETFNYKFIIYSLASLLDRTIFASFHMFFAFMNYEKKFLCEKLSEIRWRNTEKVK